MEVPFDTSFSTDTDYTMTLRFLQALEILGTKADFTPLWFMTWGQVANFFLQA